ncbi:MAG: hypothetical protein KKB79_00855 [Nanoarchaeota archaeon]|nr:hypothetical protein [Nanoarchaeota archaeon]
MIEAVVTRGRGFLDDEYHLKIPYAENPHKSQINPEGYCFRRLEEDKFPDFMEDLKEGHPAYSKLYHGVINLPSDAPFNRIAEQV